MAKENNMQLIEVDEFTRLNATNITYYMKKISSETGPVYYKIIIHFIGSEKPATFYFRNEETLNKYFEKIDSLFTIIKQDK